MEGPFYRLERYDYFVKPVPVLVGTLTVVSTIAALRYRAAIRRGLDALQQSTFFGSKPSDPFRIVRCQPEETSPKQISKTLKWLALNPEFVDRHRDAWKLTSLGDYLSTLRPYLARDQELPDWIGTEIEASLAAALLKSLGPRYGAVALPGLGSGIVQNVVRRIAATVSSYMIGATDTVLSTERDRGGTALSLAAMSYAAEANYQRLKNPQTPGREEKDVDDSGESKLDDNKSTSPLDLLRLGEVGYEPTFNDAEIRSGDLVEAQKVVPNPFIVSEHWELAIQSMEKLIIEKEQREWKSAASREDQEDGREYQYEPHSKALGTPKPIDERLLPDLHLGWGSAECTHTRRQILENRLLAVLLNRLAFNYHRMALDTDKERDVSPFQLQMSRDDRAVMTKPGEFVQALVDGGHSVETCVGIARTTFGLALCVKEKEGQNDWTNIPLAYFFLNGYADADENDAFVALPHGGLNLEVRGPLLSKGSVQHYMAIEGLCGWHSNHNPDVPWIQNVDCGEVRCGNDAVESLRVAAMEAIVINAVGTRYNLPFGGYGLTGVCNDTAGLIEHALSGDTHIYPLSFNGKFALHNLRIARELRHALTKLPNTENDVRSLDRLMHAIVSLPSDLTSTPAEAADQFRRQLHCEPKHAVFALTLQSRRVIQSIQSEVKEAER